MDLNSYRAFLTVVEEMNFTRAAKRLFVTQQSLSAQIKRMEDHYHAQFFQRRPFLRLTPEGEAMAFYARQILSTEQTAVSRFAELNHQSAGILRLGFSHQRSAAFLPGIWSRYHQEWGNISVRVKEEMTNRLLEDLRAGQVDLIVGIDISPAADLVVHPLAQERMRCILHEVLLQEYFPLDWQDKLSRYASQGVDLIELQALPLILMASNNRLRRPIEQLYRSHNIIPNISLETSSHSLMLQLGCQGDGLAIVSPLSLYEQMRAKGAFPERCHSFLVQELPMQTVSIAYRRNEELPNYAYSMVCAIQEEFRYYSDFLQRFRKLDTL